MPGVGRRVIFLLSLLGWLAVLALQGTVGDGYVLEDADVWCAGLEGPVPDRRPPEPPPPIFVDAWRVLRGGEEDGEAVLARYLLDPEGFETESWSPAANWAGSDWIAASGRVHVDQDQVRMARLPDARCLSLRGELFHGDPERRGDLGVPVELLAGWNEVVVFEPGRAFELELWAPRTRAVIATWAAGYPHSGGDECRNGSMLHVPIFNASSNPIARLHHHYGRAVGAVEGSRPPLSEHQCVGRVAPLALRVWIDWAFESSIGAGPGAGSASELLVPLCVYAEADSDADRRILRLPRDRNGAWERAESGPPERSGAPAVVSRAKALVYGTAGTARETAAQLARARFDQQRLWYATGDAPPLVSDAAWILDRATRSGSDAGGDVVLYGNAGTNAAWHALFGSELDVRVDRWGVTVKDGSRLRGEDLFGFLLRPRADAEGSVLALYGTGTIAARLGVLLDPRELPAGSGFGARDAEVLLRGGARGRWRLLGR